MRQTWKRLKERGFTVVLWELLSLKTLPVVFWTKGSKTVMKVLLFIPPVLLDQLMLHLTYSTMFGCLLGWKRLTSGYKNIWPSPVSARGVLTEARDQFHLQKRAFSLALTEHRYLDRSHPSVLCLCDQPHVSMAWGTEGHSFFCINTWDSTLMSELPGVTHIVLAVKELGTPNSKVTSENWELHMTKPVFLSHCSAEVLLYDIYTCN